MRGVWLVAVEHMALVALAGAIGCTPSEVVVRAKLEPAHENLMHVGTAYYRFNTQYRKPPTGSADLKPLLKEFGNPDDLLRSPRDGEPYVICWGVNLLVPQPWVQSTGVLAYERRGAEGKRYVLTTVQSVVLMTEEEWRRADFPPGHQPPR